VIVRDGTPADLPALTEIYNHYVVNTTATFDLEPFTVEARQEWLAHYSPAGRYRLHVATEGDDLLGYATSSRFRAKAAYDTSVETTIYCAPAATGQGVGTALYSRLFEALADVDVHRAYAGIALPNDASVALHRKFGFEVVGTYREVGRKHGSYWDVQWMERALP
jgi:phosphinothricin acetyltransferase